MTYIVLGNNSDGKVQAFGTPTGRPFTSEAQAERAMKKMEARIPHANFLVLPVCEQPDLLG